MYAYYLLIYYQFTGGSTAIETSIYLLPFILILVAFDLIDGQFMGKTGYCYPWYIFGAAFELISGVLLGEFFSYISNHKDPTADKSYYKIDTVDEDTSDAKICSYTIILGTDVGCFC